MAQGSNTRICDLCGGRFGYGGCWATCPSRQGWRRQDVADMLMQGNVLHGLAPTSRLVAEAIFKIDRREESLQYLETELDDKIQELAHEFWTAQRDLDEVRRVQQVMRDLQQQGSPSPRVGQHSGQPESEPSEHGGS